MGSLEVWVAHMMQQHAHQSALYQERIALQLAVPWTNEVNFSSFLKCSVIPMQRGDPMDDEETAKKEALASAAVVSDLLVESVNGGVQQAFINEKQIEMEARSLGITVQRFVKQTAQWLAVVHTFDSALKEIGDFENWIKTMEYDCEKIAGTLRMISSSTGEPTKPS